MGRVFKWCRSFLGLILVTVFVNYIMIKLRIGERNIFEFLEYFFRVVMLLVKSHLVFTLKNFLRAYILAILIAVPLGLALGRCKNIATIFKPMVEFLRPIPAAVLIPIALCFFGIENRMKIFVIFYGAFWPLLITTIYGARDIDHSFIETGRVYNLTKFQILRTIIFPASMPHIVSGARISLSIALLLTVTVEMIAPGDPIGLGFYIIDMERAHKFTEMFVAVLLVAILGILLNFLFGYLEKYLKKRYGDYIPTY